MVWSYPDYMYEIHTELHLYFRNFEHSAGLFHRLGKKFDWLFKVKARRTLTTCTCTVHKYTSQWPSCAQRRNIFCLCLPKPKSLSLCCISHPDACRCGFENESRNGEMPFLACHSSKSPAIGTKKWKSFCGEGEKVPRQRWNHILNFHISLAIHGISFVLKAGQNKTQY